MRKGPDLLFAVLGGGGAWVLHFLGSYALVAIGCAAGWGGLRPALVLATLVLAGVAVWASVLSWRDWRALQGRMPWDAALSETLDWRPFLLLTGVMLGAIAAGTILVEGFVSLLAPVCSRSGAS